MRFLTLFSLILLFVLQPRSVMADIVNEFVQIQCNQDLNFLKIEELNINGQLSREYAKNNPDQLWEKYGLLSVEYRLLDVNLEEKPYSQRSQEFSTECLLKKENGDKDLYKILVKGYTVKGNPNSMCGGHWSSSFSIWRGEEQLIDELSFAPSCLGDVGSIDIFSLLPHEEYMYFEIKSRAGDNEGSRFQSNLDLYFMGKKFHLVLFLDKRYEQPDFPITNKIIFGEYKTTP